MKSKNQGKRKDETVMIRKIIKIDETKCNGCGMCADACNEGAIAIINGKAKLIRDDYCDGLGNCLPVCPTGAISFEERKLWHITKKRLITALEAVPAVWQRQSSQSLNLSIILKPYKANLCSGLYKLNWFR